MSFFNVSHDFFKVNKLIRFSSSPFLKFKLKPLVHHRSFILNRPPVGNFSIFWLKSNKVQSVFFNVSYDFFKVNKLIRFSSSPFLKFKLKLLGHCHRPSFILNRPNYKISPHSG